MMSRLVSLLGFSVRMLGLAGRFVFIFVAATWMTSADFGVYGLIATATFLILQVVGLEAYQVTLRNVASKAEIEIEKDERGHYGNFVLLSSVLAFVVGYLFAWSFGWPIYVSLLCAAIVSSEYVGTEVYRILIAENHAVAAMFSIGIRYIPWNFGFPIASYVGLIETPWPLEWVLGVWLASSLAGVFFALPFLTRYISRPSYRFKTWYTQALQRAPRWVTIAMCGRFLENGVRIVPGLLVGEEEAGRFIFFATLASVGATGLKTAIEPFFYVQLVQPPDPTEARHKFAMVSMIWLVIGAVVSVASLWVLEYFNQREIFAEDRVLLGYLILGASALALSQVPHFGLFAARKDDAILWTSAATLAVSVALSFLLTMTWGTLGTAASVLVGALLLGGLKAGAFMWHQREVGALHYS